MVLWLSTGKSCTYFGKHPFSVIIYIPQLEEVTSRHHLKLVTIIFTHYPKNGQQNCQAIKFQGVFFIASFVAWKRAEGLPTGFLFAHVGLVVSSRVEAIMDL